METLAIVGASLAGLSAARAARAQGFTGRLVIIAGLAVVVLGVLWELGIRVGRLPGDVVLRGRNSTFYFPVVTSLLLSVLLSLVLWLINRR